MLSKYNGWPYMLCFELHSMKSARLPKVLHVHTLQVAA
jgi:hypothetical protein